jgi:hypothetical protein
MFATDPSRLQMAPADATVHEGAPTTAHPRLQVDRCQYRTTHRLRLPAFADLSAIRCMFASCAPRRAWPVPGTSLARRVDVSARTGLARPCERVRFVSADPTARAAHLCDVQEWLDESAMAQDTGETERDQTELGGEG